MKSNRQVKILELIRENEIETQEELSEYLKQEGFKVTQATVSRDIRALKLTKVALKGGRQKYAVLPEETEDMAAKYVRVLKDGFVSMGMAMAVAAALDAMQCREIVGSIAGDDTIMCVVRTAEDTMILMERLYKMLESV